MKVFHTLGLFEDEDLDYGAVGIRFGRGSRGGSCCRSGCRRYQQHWALRSLIAPILIRSIITNPLRWELCSALGGVIAVRICPSK